MITLYGAGASLGLPEASPHVIETEVYLRMTGLPYVKQVARPQLPPKGQLPWIDDEGERIADSYFIRLHLERKYDVDFDEGLSALERAQAWAIERMIENHFDWTTVLGVRSLAALSGLLGDKPFLMGSRPTSVDAVAFGALASLMTFGNLAAYVDRMMAGVYPDFVWSPENLPAEPAFA
jgi:glutathione S-transferase